MYYSELNEKYSVINSINIFNNLQTSISLLKAELCWHYSNHFFAECKGEEVIENILCSTTNKKQRAILNTQLRDEKLHSALFRSIIDKIGLDTRANSYSLAYAEMVKDQNSLAEKVYVFQILTEAASSAYCEWRLLAVQNQDYSSIDKIVLRDEKRHLVMGHSMLDICDSEEIKLALTKTRRTELLKQMNKICKLTGPKKMAEVLLKEYSENRNLELRKTHLDQMVTRAIFQEVKAIDDKLDKIQDMTESSSFITT